MQYFVYVLISKKNGGCYIGHTNDINRRLEEHNNPESKGFTVRHRPWELMHVEEFRSRAEAMRREKYLKSLKNRDRIIEQITAG